MPVDRDGEGRRAGGARLGDLYRSENLLAVGTLSDPARFDAHGFDLVTFEPLAGDRGQEPFGRRFAERYGINAAHVVASGDHWYQYRDLEACLSRVAERTGPDAAIYGSSMGGYAATTYGDLFPGRRIIALSPQFTIKPDIPPHDRRWARYAERIDFRPDSEQVCRTCRMWILFDPANRDAEHARLIAERTPATLIEVPGGGHPVGPVLAETGRLSSLILDIMRGEPDPDMLRRRVLEGLDRSPLHHFNRAAATRGAERIERLMDGLALNGGHVRLRSLWALMLLAADRPIEALAHLEFVLSRRPEHPSYRLQYRRACDAAGAAPVLLSVAPGSVRPTPDAHDPERLEAERAILDRAFSRPSGSALVERRRAERVAERHARRAASRNAAKD